MQRHLLSLRRESEPVKNPKKQQKKQNKTKKQTHFKNRQNPYREIDEEAENKKQKMQRTLEAINKKLFKKSGNDAEKTAKRRRGAKRTLSEL